MNKRGNQTNRLMVIGTLAVLALQVSTPAQAGLVMTSGPYSFGGSASVTDSKATPGASNNNGASLGDPILVPQFDAALGVLTGVSHQIVSMRTVGLTGSGSGGTGTLTATGNTSATANFVAPGAIATFGSLTIQSTNNAHANCSSAAECSYSTTSGNMVANGSYGVGTTFLNAYVGDGTVQTTRTAPSLSVTSGGSKTVTTATATQSWNGTLTTSYHYLLHAAPSFDGNLLTTALSLDFGDVLLGSSVDPLLFSVFNLADLNRVALNLDKVAGSGDTDILATDISAFMYLTEGQSADVFSAFFDTSALGRFNASYLLTFSDEDKGATASQFNGLTMTLNLSGKVVPVPVQALAATSVPEPGSLALFGVAIFGLAWSRRARTSRVVA